MRKPVDIQSPTDIVALIPDKGDLFCAIIENPDAVKTLADKVRTLLVASIKLYNLKPTESELQQNGEAICERQSNGE